MTTSTTKIDAAIDSIKPRAKARGATAPIMMCDIAVFTHASQAHLVPCSLMQATSNASLKQEINTCTVPSPEACEKAIMADEDLATFHIGWRGYHPEWETYRGAFGLSLLHLAAEKNNASNILFLTRIINPNVRDSKGCTPLHTAAECGNAQCVIALILAGADVNAYDNRRETPIFYAVRAWNAEALATLLQCWAAPRARNAKGKTAADYIEDGAEHLRDIFSRYR